MSFQDTGFQNSAYQTIANFIIRVILNTIKLIIPQTLVKLNTSVVKATLKPIDIGVKLMLNPLEGKLSNTNNTLEVKLND